MKMTMIPGSDIFPICEKALNLTVFVLVAILLLGGVPWPGVTKTATQYKSWRLKEIFWKFAVIESAGCSQRQYLRDESLFDMLLNETSAKQGAITSFCIGCQCQSSVRQLYSLKIMKVNQGV